LCRGGPSSTQPRRCHDRIDGPLISCPTLGSIHTWHVSTRSGAVVILAPDQVPGFFFRLLLPVLLLPKVNANNRAFGAILLRPFDCRGTTFRVTAHSPNESDRASSKAARFLRVARACWGPLLLGVIVCSALLFSAYGDRLTSAVCREAHRVSPFRGPLSSLCHRIVIQRLFFDGSSAFVEPL